MGVPPQVSGAAVEKQVSPGMSAELGQLFLWWEINPVGCFLVMGESVCYALIRLPFFSRQNPTPHLPASEGPMHSLFSPVRLFATPWTVAHQAPLSMGFSRQESWSGLPCPPPGDLPNPGIEPVTPVSPALTSGFSTAEPRAEAPSEGRPSPNPLPCMESLDQYLWVPTTTVTTTTATTGSISVRGVRAGSLAPQVLQP